MLVKDAMTKKVTTINKDKNLLQALHVMCKKQISGCPVVNKDNEVVGVVSESDLIRATDLHAKIIDSKQFLPYMFEVLVKGDNSDALMESLQKLKKIKVKTIMKKKVIQIDENANIFDAAKLMNRHKINRLPVLCGKKAVGILTRGDIIKAIEAKANSF